MKASNMFAPTLREVPAEAEIISHKLMLRAGMLRKTASGVYTYLPLAWRSIRKIEEIVRQEDPRAFTIIASATEIYGEGYKSIFSQKL